MTRSQSTLTELARAGFSHLNRASLELQAVEADLEHHLGVSFTPDEVRITRWPAAFALYRPHHAAWVDDVEAALPSGVFVTGAGFRGIGIPACIRAATSIAARASGVAIDLAESR